MTNYESCLDCYHGKHCGDCPCCPEPGQKNGQRKKK